MLEGRLPLWLALLLAEAAALIHLTQGELGQAQADVGKAAALVAAYPTILGGHAGSVHMLAGEAQGLGTAACTCWRVRLRA